MSSTIKFRVFLLLILTHLMSLSFAQTYEINGTVKDSETLETLVGVSIVYATNKGVASDLDGNFKLTLPAGSNKITASFVGYESQTIEINVNKADLTVAFKLKSKTNLKEIEITADVAKNRETPVAFSTISAKQLQQELGTRDLPMVLNSTPGVYATESGGGSGDARINVRGFDQRNVAVMIDGVPFNDMENGAVYWSNWEGLGDVTGNMQVQRGLGASKLALPSVGGTINVLTKGIDERRGGMVKQEVGNNNSLKTSVAYNSGVLNNALGVTVAFSKRTGDGWVDRTWIKSYSYFLKLQKRFENHLVSISMNGANQSHAQRTNQYSMAVYDTDYALKNGMSKGFIDSLSLLDNSLNKGLKYNRQWGTFTDTEGKEFVVNEKINFYTKPVFSVSDFYEVNNKLTLSNVAYLSIGTGGGTTMQNIPSAGTDSLTGQYNYKPAYDANVASGIASTYSRASYNNHFWYGLLSSMNYKISEKLSFQLGADLRSYRGGHYQTPYDFIGGTYINDVTNKNQPNGLNNEEFQIRKIGEKVGYNYDGIVKWGGGFTQLEYKKDKFSTFINVTSSLSSYQRIDYFAKRDLVLADTTYLLALGYADTITRNGQKYNFTSAETRDATTEVKKFLGYTFKTGGNYNINDNHNVFINLGYMKLAPKFNNVFDRNNRLFSDVDYQYVKAIEGGYGYRTKKLNVNLNAYYTIWKNRPPDFTPSKTIEDPVLGTTVLYYNINGLDALHKGIEIDGLFKFTKKWSLNAVVSIGDWVYTSKRDYNILDVNGNPAINPDTYKPFDTQSFSAVGVHVGNAAQIQYSSTLNFEPTKNIFIKARYTYFDKNYASFDPTTLGGINADRESWKLPAYGMLDAFAGYTFKIYKEIKMSLGASVTNVLNAVYLTDAQNNGLSTRNISGNKPIGDRFNAESAAVFFGQGRRYNTTIKIMF
jgi:iron complex outermembrane receptor protein